MPKYWKFTPRGFGNEYAIIKTICPEEENLLWKWWCDRPFGGNSNLERVTVRELRKLAAMENLRSRYDYAFSGNCNPDNPMNVKEFLRERYEREGNQ